MLRDVLHEVVASAADLRFAARKTSTMLSGLRLASTDLACTPNRCSYVDDCPSFSTIPRRAVCGFHWTTTTTDQRRAAPQARTP